VRAAATARTHRQMTETATLVTEILAGRAARSLPPSIAAAVAQLDRAVARLQFASQSG
jgi:hypothetical protein